MAADHVAIVTRVNSNGTIETDSGDWAGASGSEATFASTSHVDLNAPAYGSSVGSTPGIMGMTISGFVSPAGTGGSPAGCRRGLQLRPRYGHLAMRGWPLGPATERSGRAPCPGVTPSDYCSEGGGYCTSTSQKNHHWVPRS